MPQPLCTDGGGADDRIDTTDFGAVLFGIGLALLVERFRGQTKLTGLGLGGAICINLCGAVVLAGWLLVGNLVLPIKGFVILWGLVAVLVGISAFELMSNRRLQ